VICLSWRGQDIVAIVREPPVSRVKSNTLSHSGSMVDARRPQRMQRLESRVSLSSEVSARPKLTSSVGDRLIDIHIKMNISSIERVNSHARQCDLLREKLELLCSAVY